MVDIVLSKQEPLFVVKLDLKPELRAILGMSEDRSSITRSFIHGTHDGSNEFGFTGVVFMHVLAYGWLGVARNMSAHIVEELSQVKGNVDVTAGGDNKCRLVRCVRVHIGYKLGHGPDRLGYYVRFAHDAPASRGRKVS